MWFFAILVVLAMGGIAMVAAGRGTPMSREYDDRPDVLVPRDRTLVGDDLRTVRFSLAFRGYRMSEVDALLDRLAREMEDRDTPDPGAARVEDDATAD
ncbi:DivIVA domain-containing protein [Nocardioides islandensis]|jgi:DivIVA domain-containing protein|uniref:DivIVA domain-containing protein n=1 Tax=Nocardioides islandensis TaxID=433663 RepID=A0A930VD09_9ACTN|nr:DivIVA domain-containing protein [Nocardioides islandensis]MBF4764223.1 DivIVA domain-containing protein [Nocardioides islandensis]